MSLLDAAMEDCVIIDRITSLDSYGGLLTTYVEGAPVNAAFDFLTSVQSRIAGVSVVIDRYTITTRREILLQPHMLLKRLSDGKVFEITSDGADKKTPKSASLNMRQVTAKEYVFNEEIEKQEDRQ